MKRAFVIPSIALALFCSSCVKEERIVEYEYSVYYNFDDPIARALNEIKRPYPSHGQFDVGLVVQRYMYATDPPDSGADVHMALNLHGFPTRARTATVEDLALNWLTYSGLGDTLGYYGRSMDFGRNDSIQFSYVYQDSDSYSGMLSIAPPFANLKFPDTVSLSGGFTISYSDSHPGDSISVTIQANIYSAGLQPAPVMLVVPDTGTIHVFGTSLPRNAGIFNLDITLVRERLVTHVSASGKRIGVLSNVATFATVGTKR